MNSPFADNDKPTPDAGGHLVTRLIEDGYVHIPRFVPPSRLADLQHAVRSALAAAPFGLDERTLKPETETSRTGLGEGVDVFPIYQMAHESLKLVPSDPLLNGMLTALLGKDFYLDRSIIRKARAGSPRFYYHKDQHGDIGLAILIEDHTTDVGSTTLIPGVHFGTPPTIFALRNVNVAHPREVQMVGHAGDAYLFTRDIDHSRAPNRTKHDTVQLLYTFVNKNTRPSAHSRQVIGAGDLAGLPEDVRHMLRPYDGDPDGLDGSIFDRYVYQSGYFSAGAGDYDVRNDLIRDFFYTIRHSRDGEIRNERGEYYRNVSLVNEMRRVRVIDYLRAAEFSLVARNLLLQLARKSAFGQRVLAWLSERRRRAA